MEGPLLSRVEAPFSLEMKWLDNMSYHFVLQGRNEKRFIQCGPKLAWGPTFQNQVSSQVFKEMQFSYLQAILSWDFFVKCVKRW